MLIITLIELAKDPLLSPMKKRFPSDPAVVVDQVVVTVCPTTALENDLVLVNFPDVFFIASCVFPIVV